MYCALKDETGMCCLRHFDCMVDSIGVTSTWKAMENHNVKPTVQTFTIILKMFAAVCFINYHSRFLSDSLAPSFGKIADFYGDDGTLRSQA
jgi:hypothetical protein